MILLHLLDDFDVLADSGRLLTPVVESVDGGVDNLWGFDGVVVDLS